MTDYASIHQPVLLEQCVSLVAPALQDPGSIAVDCTLGLAGHTIAFLKAAPQARVLGIDRDAEALAMATERIAGEGFRTASYLSTPHSTRSARCLTTRASIG